MWRMSHGLARGGWGLVPSEVTDRARPRNCWAGLCVRNRTARICGRRARRYSVARFYVRNLSVLSERSGNLCDVPVFTGYTRDGGFATHVVADGRFCFPLGERGEVPQIARWLWAGLIGWRSYRVAGEGQTLGLYGFGAAAHILIQVATRLGRRVLAFTRRGDEAAQNFARSLGAVWAGP